MNSLERIMAILKGEPVDHVPVGAVLSLYGARLTGCDLKSFYQDPKAYVAGQVAVMAKFQPDFVMSPLCVANEAKAFGCDIRYFTDNAPNVTKRAISRAKDYQLLQIPSIETDPNLRFTRDCIRLLAERYHGEVPVAAVWMDPFNILALAVGVETFMELILFEKDSFEALIQDLSEFCILYGNAMLADGADFLIGFSSLCNVAMITNDMAESIVFPALQKVYQGLNGGVIMHAGGYKIGPYLPIYKHLPNLLGFIIDSRDHLESARDQGGPGVMILGNLDGPKLNLWSPEQIQKIAYHKLASMRNDPHFMLCTSAADVPFETSEEQICALMEAPRKFSQMMAAGNG